jgi:hypothetical protein
MRPVRPTVWLSMWLAGAALGGLTTLAAADEGRGLAVPLLPKYAQECASCHIAYPPGLLPSASWKRLMEGLPRHFGTDASLDAATVQELSTWLQANAADTRARTRSSLPPPEDRITRSPWFVHEHDEIPAATWKLPAVKSPSNCAACHQRADQGVFDEHDVRIPR